MSTSKLFDSFKLGPITLANRIVMAPLTRNRAVPEGLIPSPLAAEYYGQRATAGLLITEATPVSQQGQGYQDTPGIYSDAQVAGWKKVTDAVHKRGGKIFIQLWHVGRVSHVDLQPNGGAPVAPSAIKANTKTFVGRQVRRRLRAARARAERDPGHRRRLPQGAPPTPSRPASTASRSTAPTAICSTSSPATAPTSAPTPMAARSRTAPG